MSDRLSSLSAFYPMYNEEDNIEEAVARALAVLPEVAERWEVIIVDDGSTDRTGRLARALEKKHAGIHVVTHASNLGYGAAVASGIRSADLDYVFDTDGDNQFDISEITKLVPLASDAEIVTGHRQTRRDAWTRRVNAYLFNLAVRAAFGLKIRDIDCAFKLFHASIFHDMELRSRGALIDAEILSKAHRQGKRIAEVPIRHFPRQAGRQSGADPRVILRAMKEFISLWIEVRRVTSP